MIQFLCSKPHKQREIIDVIGLLNKEIEVEFLDDSMGILMSANSLNQSLELLGSYLLAEGHFVLTMLETFAVNEMSTKCLLALHRSHEGSFLNLNECLMVAIAKKDKEILDCAAKFYEILPQQDLNLVISYCQTESVKDTAIQLYVHRNTVTNAINRFQIQTHMDLKSPKQRYFLVLLSNYIRLVHNAQDN